MRQVREVPVEVTKEVVKVEEHEVYRMKWWQTLIASIGGLAIVGCLCVLAAKRLTK